MFASTWRGEHLTIKIDRLDEADVVRMRAVEAEQICRDVLIILDLKHHPDMHFVPLDILHRPCTGQAMHPMRTQSCAGLEYNILILQQDMHVVITCIGMRAEHCRGDCCCRGLMSIEKKFDHVCRRFYR